MLVLYQTGGILTPRHPLSTYSDITYVNR